ncbi:MAG: thioredoxin [Clostridiaceae bacterium]|nr:thioredoxin [Clostridiaceae bacterium]
MAVKILDKDNFEDTINSGKTVVVDFFATWCGPCKMMAPVLDELSGELSEDKLIAKLDIDQNVNLARKFSVMSVPTLVAFKNGKAVTKMVGLRPKEDVIELLETASKA